LRQAGVLDKANVISFEVKPLSETAGQTITTCHLAIQNGGTMSTLNDFLSQKRQALQTRRAKFQTTPPEPKMVKVHVNVEGGSGIRRIRIHDHQVLIDSPYDFAGYDLGPNAVELQLGVLGSCLTSIFLIQAADKGIPLDEVSLEVTGQMDMRAGKPGYEHIPIYPHHIEYTVHIKSSASPETLADLHQTVERGCPIFNLLANPQIIKGTLVQTGTLTETKAAVKKATPDFYYHEGQ
jgi:uncharacterized OsmC-like protein